MDMIILGARQDRHAAAHLGLDIPQLSLQLLDACFHVIEFVDKLTLLISRRAHA